MRGQQLSSLILPGPTDRWVIVGSTGSGKTQLGAWALGTRNYKARPWTIFNTKGDELLNEIPATEISPKDKPPKKPGLYMMRPLPDIDDDAVNNYLYKVWQNENHGLYIDEGYMIPKGSMPFRAILTQGRSKHIPMITLSQRPVHMDRFVFSEGTFFNVFRLTDKRDRDTVKSMVPVVATEEPLDEWNSYYYNVKKNQLQVMRPVPDANTILEMFNTRDANKQRII